MANNPGAFPEQTLGKLIVGPGQQHGEVPAADGLGAIVVSESIRDMHALCGEGSDLA